MKFSYLFSRTFIVSVRIFGHAPLGIILVFYVKLSFDVTHLALCLRPSLKIHLVCQPVPLELAPSVFGQYIRISILHWK